MLGRVVRNICLTGSNLKELARDQAVPTMRLGVTGFAGTGKTVFATALGYGLINGGHFSLFDAFANGRLYDCHHVPGGRDGPPLFDLDGHMGRLRMRRQWPQSTRNIAQMRLQIDYESASTMRRRLSRGRLYVDMIDYPGEWLIDLPLLARDFRAFSADAMDKLEILAGLAQLRAPVERFMRLVRSVDPAALAEDRAIGELTASWSAILERLHGEARASPALPLLAPGRLFAPQEEGTGAQGGFDAAYGKKMAASPSPAPPVPLFAPLEFAPGTARAARIPASLAAIFEARYENYRKLYVQPFFDNYFSRIDRQIVLVDTLRAINGGPAGVALLSRSIGEVLSLFSLGPRQIWSRLVNRRADRLLFAATKADLLHQRDHERLERLTARIVGNAGARPRGVMVDVMALAAIRATRQAQVRRNGEVFPAIVGMVDKGEMVDGKKLPRAREIAWFPGDLPDDPGTLMNADKGFEMRRLKFLPFCPPGIDPQPSGAPAAIPHIGLDRAMEFLLGDWLR